MIESSVQQIQQRLTCPVCLDRYKVPKLLPCQHTFCLNPCLTNLIDTSTRKIKCPECRMLHSLPSTGRVESFPNNITILRCAWPDRIDIPGKGYFYLSRKALNIHLTNGVSQKIRI